MEEIPNNHLGCIKPVANNGRFSISTGDRRISAINSTNPYCHGCPQIFITKDEMSTWGSKPCGQIPLLGTLFGRPTDATKRWKNTSNVFFWWNKGISLVKTQICSKIAPGSVFCWYFFGETKPPGALFAEAAAEAAVEVWNFEGSKSHFLWELGACWKIGWCYGNLGHRRAISSNLHGAGYGCKKAQFLPWKKTLKNTSNKCPDSSHFFSSQKATAKIHIVKVSFRIVFSWNIDICFFEKGQLQLENHRRKWSATEFKTICCFSFWICVLSDFFKIRSVEDSSESL